MKTCAQAIKARLRELRDLLRESGEPGKLDKAWRDGEAYEVRRRWILDFADACWRGEDIPPACWRSADRVMRPEDVTRLHVRHNVARSARR